MKPFNFLLILASFFTNFFQKFKDSSKANLSQTIKGVIKEKHIKYLEGMNEVKNRHSRLIRYTGLKKYHKVPTIQP